MNGALPLTLGFTPVSTQSGGSSILALSGANTWLSFSSIAKETGAMSEFMVYCYANAGTLGNISGSLTVTGDINGVSDNTPLAGTSTIIIPAGKWPAAGNWAKFIGFTCVRTAGARYHYIIKNLSSVPGTDYPSILYGASGTGQFPANSYVSTWGCTKVHTLDAGVTWASSPAYTIAGFRIRHAGGYDGSPIRSLTSITAANCVYSNHELGVVFTTPANGALRIGCISLPVGKTGTPTGNLRYRMYIGDNDPITTSVIPPGNVPSTTLWITLHLPYIVEIPPSTEVIIMASETTQSDASTDRYNLSAFTVEDSAESKAMMPFDGTLQRIETADATAEPIVWTRTDTSIIPVALMLDSPEFKAPIFPDEADVSLSEVYGFNSEYTGSKVCAASGSDRHYARRGHRRVRGK